jgi:hypothetical protein
MRRKMRALVLVGGLGIATLGLAGCHQPADVVCEAYKPHRPSLDVVTFAAWDPPPSGQQYGGRYTCSALHTTTGARHRYCVYPPDHYPPPDNEWSWTPDCSF